MAIPMRQDQQQDADAVYVRDRIASADRLEAEGKAEEQSGSTKRKQAEQERIQAGLRLIDVRERFVKECGQDRCPHEFAPQRLDQGGTEGDDCEVSRTSSGSE